MDHRGIQYQVVQTASPTGYRWTVQLNATRMKTGTSSSRGNAIFQAARAIDLAIRVENKYEDGQERSPIQTNLH